MDNAIKRQLNPGELAAIVSKAFGSRRSIKEVRELKDGWFNSAYALLLNDGTRAVLKAAPAEEGGMMRYERHVMRTEVEVLRLLKRTGEVPVPEVYDYQAVDSGIECFLMEYLPGTPYNKVKADLPKEEREQIERELGGYNRRINETRGGRFGYYSLEEQQGSDWADVFTEMVTGILADAKDRSVTLPAREEEIMALVESRRESLKEVVDPSLVHWDLWDGNVFIAEGRIIGLIDCERALWGDPLMEYYYRGLAGEVPAFHEGYGKTEFSEREKERMGLYDLYLALILHIECTYRQYGDQDYIRWAASHLTQTWESLKSARS